MIKVCHLQLKSRRQRHTRTEAKGAKNTNIRNGRSLPFVMLWCTCPCVLKKKHGDHRPLPALVATKAIITLPQGELALSLTVTHDVFVLAVCVTREPKASFFPLSGWQSLRSTCLLTGGTLLVRLSLAPSVVCLSPPHPLSGALMRCFTCAFLYLGV